MKLLPFGLTLPVHCCCEPNKRLGWVPVPPARLEWPGNVRFMMKRPSYELLTGKYSGPIWIETFVEWMHGHPAYDGDQLCVSSNDIPIEQWRKVAGFIEDRSQ